MDSWSRVPDAPDPDAMAFVRFCRGRRRVAWPELYDEMWAVASRGLFRGWGFGELEGRGIGFGLFQMRSLAALVAIVIDEEPRGLSGRRRAGVPPGPQRRGLAIMEDREITSADPGGNTPGASPTIEAQGRQDAAPRDAQPLIPRVGAALAVAG